MTPEQNNIKLPGPRPSSSTLRARPPAPRSDINSLRRASHWPPEDPDHLFDGFDRTAADLSWTAPLPEDINPRTGSVWLYPKKRGNGPSNLEDFREEIEERTRNGQGGKAIAEALIEKGVDTSGKAVSAQRLRWGIRTKAPRRTTERGIANIKKAHLERKAREANTVRVRSLPQKDRVRKMRQAEVLRLSREGMSISQIEESLKARGVIYERGGFKRLCTKLGLDPDPQDSVKAIRHHYYNQARTQQKHEFENFAAELGVQDVEEWVKSKMDEECFIIARRERAHKLMGDLRPTHPYPAKTKSRAQATRAEQHHAEPSADQQASSAQTDIPPESRGADGPIEISDDDTDMGSQRDDDCEGGDDEQAPANILSRPSSVGRQTDGARLNPSQRSSENAESSTGLQFEAPRAEPASYTSQQSQAAPYQSSGHNSTIVPSFGNAVPRPHLGTGRNTREMLAVPTSAGQGHPIPSQQQQQQPPQYFHPSPAVPFQYASQVRVEPQQACAPTTGHRPIAPRPVCTRPVVQPPLPNIPGVAIPPGEAEMMATYGLYPVPTSKTTTQRFQTPNGLVRTNGYEYLPLASTRRSQLESPTPGEVPQQQPQQSPLSQQSCSPLTLNNAAPHMQPNPPRAGAVMMPTHSLPRLSNMTATPQPISRKDASTQTVGHETVPAPPPPRSSIPAPSLNIPTEEAERHKASYETVLKHQKATLECMEYLMARAEARPVPESLTGLPPSLKDVEIAKVRLRESAEALLASLV